MQEGGSWRRICGSDPPPPCPRGVSICEAWRVSVSESTLSKMLRRMGWTRKKGRWERAKGETTVVLRPREGETVSSPVTVSGYSRNFEASNTASVFDYDGRVLASRNAIANDWIEAWGYFETSLEVPDYEGRTTIMVGVENPRDGVFEGIEVPVYLRDDQAIGKHKGAASNFGERRSRIASQP